jgi:hypothetical protein
MLPQNTENVLISRATIIFSRKKYALILLAYFPYFEKIKVDL